MDSPELAFQVIAPLGPGGAGGQASLFLAHYLLGPPPPGWPGHARGGAQHQVGGPFEVVLKRTTAKSREQLEQAEQEVALLRRAAGHPNIVRFLHAFSQPLEGGGREISLLIEYCPLGNLLTFSQARLQQGRPLTEVDIVQLFVQACRAVEYLHLMGVAHRDIKLENLLLTSHDEAGTRLIVKLCDLGSATTRRLKVTTKQERAALEAEVERLTTHAYRAPELVDLFSRKLVCEQVDIWALGCVLYALAFSCHAFTENLAILNAKYVLPASPAYSPEFRRLFPWLFDVDPISRPRIGDVVDELDELLRNKIKVFATARGSGRGNRSYLAAKQQQQRPHQQLHQQQPGRPASSTKSSGPPPAAAAPTPISQPSATASTATRGAAFHTDNPAMAAAAAASTSSSSARSGALESRKTKRAGASMLPSVAPPPLPHPSNGDGPPAKSNNPFDDLPPSFDPTFFSTPGMSSASLVGFPVHVVTDSSVHVDSHAHDLDSFANAHTNGSASGFASFVSMPAPASADPWALISSSESTQTLPTAGAVPPPPSHAPIFFSDPPPTYHRKQRG